MIRRSPNARPVVNRRKSSPKRRGQFLLEVRARRNKEIQQRNNRVFNITCRFFLLLTVTGLILYGGHTALQKLFYVNPEFQLKEITVQIDGTLTRDQVMDICGISEGMNIFSVNLGNLRHRLEAMPRVQSASVERRLPGTISIEITERRPVAWLAPLTENADPFTSPDSLLLDSRAIAVKPGDMQPEYLYLPIIYGVDTTQIMSGEAVNSYSVRAALDLLRLVEHGLGQPRFRIQSIDLRKGYCMVVSDARHGRFTFGLDALESQLERLNALLAHTDTHRLEIETANLMLKRNMPVTFVQVANPEPDPTIVAPATPATRSGTSSRR